MDSRPLILASASPQRKTLLKGLGVSFSVIPSAFNESACAEQDPGKRAVLLAELKAADVAMSHARNIVIGCDTLVALDDGVLLEKPADAADAERMLRLQSGRTCVVHSGLCLVVPREGEKQHFLRGIASTRVTFARLSEETIRWWIGTGLWKDRSGAFQIDGPGQLMIERIEGDWTCVVGLPIFLLGQMLAEAGYPLGA